jgi:hypothetical protein
MRRANGRLSRRSYRPSLLFAAGRSPRNPFRRRQGCPPLPLRPDPGTWRLAKPTARRRRDLSVSAGGKPAVTPTVLAASRRPPYVRGPRNTPVGTDQDDIKRDEANGPRSREFPASGTFRRWWQVLSKTEGHRRHLGSPVAKETLVTEKELDRNAARRLAIIRHAEEVTGNVAKTCRYYGISRQVF